MERAIRLRYLLLASAIFSSSLIFWRPAGAPPPSTAEASTETATTTTVPTGVVLDFTNPAASGKKSLTATMALEDFYVNRPTRVDLHDRDSRGDPATAAHSAEDLIKSAQVLSRKGYSFDNSRRSVFRREDTVMTSKGKEKTGFPLNLDTKYSLNLESKRRNARKLVGVKSEKSCRSYNEKLLKIGVPHNDGFKAFLNVSDPYFFCKDNDTRPSTTKQVTGYSIDVFKTAMEKLLDPPCYEFCIFDGTYDELVGNVSLGILDGVAGDVTITANRIREVDFTMPYTQSGVSLLVPSKSDLEPIQWTFLAPLTVQLWIATVGFFFFTGFVVWVIERPRNSEYQGSNLRQFSNSLYFAFSTLTFSHAHIIRSPLSRIVVVVWCFLLLVLVQSYTASFSSILTAERLHPTVTSLDQLLVSGDYVGCQHNSFVYSMLRGRGFSEHRLIAYSTEDEYADALRKGSMNGGVSAIVDEVPYLTSFLYSNARYQNEFQIVGHVYKTPGLGFVFPLGFPLLHDISTAILNITEGNEGSKFEEKWFGKAATPPTVSNKPSTPLTLKSFSGLFLISGIISSLMLIISVMRLVLAKWTELRHGGSGRMDNTPGDEESRELQDGTGNTPMLDHPEPSNRGRQQVSSGSGDVEERDIDIHAGNESQSTPQNDEENGSVVVHEQPVQEVRDNDSQGAHVSIAISGDEEAGGVIQDSMSNASKPAPDVYVQIEMTSTSNGVGGAL